VPIPLSDVKKDYYTKINPNGRLPSIYDPNTDLTLWESGAIIEYLVDKYDKDHKISFAPGSAEAYHAKQWLFFQASGQGPYYGQASWFKKFHPERIPSALERYVKEINRVTGVLEKYLAEEKEKLEPGAGGPWLVGNKFSYADIAFISWQVIVTRVITPEDGYNPDDFPVVKDWVNRQLAREKVKAFMDDPAPIL